MRVVPPVALDGGIERKVLAHADLRPQDVELGAHPQALPDARHVCQDGRPVHARIPACRRQHACQDGDRRRLAGPVVPCMPQKMDSNVCLNSELNQQCCRTSNQPRDL